MNFKRCKDFLDVFLNARIDSDLEGEDIDKAKNVGLRVYDQGIVTYEQNKTELSANHDKCYVMCYSYKTVTFLSKALQPPIIDVFITFERL